MKTNTFYKNLIFIILLFTTINAVAQKDTTELKMGDKKILIIQEGEEIEEGITELRKGVIDFEVKINNFEKKNKALLDSNKVYNDKLKDSSDENVKNLMQLEIDSNNIEITENQKKIEAYKKGIDQINKDIDDLKIKLDDLSEELGENDDDEDDFNFDLNDLSKFNQKKFKGHWAGFEFGLNNFTNVNRELKLPDNGMFMELNPSKSWGLGFNFFQYSIPVIKNYAGFVTGMGFEWNNFNLKQNIDLIEDSLGTIRPLLIASDVKRYSKNTLNMVYFKIPLIFEFQIPTGKKDNRIFCGVGIDGSLKLSSKAKKIYDLNGDTNKDKLKGEYRLSPFRYGLSARIGYRFIQLYANYSLTPLFEKNRGPELFPVTAGLRIGF